MVGAGSTGGHSSVRILQNLGDKNMDNQNKLSITNEIKGINEGCYSLDFHPKKAQIAFTTAHHGFYVYDLQKKWLKLLSNPSLYTAIDDYQPPSLLTASRGSVLTASRIPVFALYLYLAFKWVLRWL